MYLDWVLSAIAVTFPGNRNSILKRLSNVELSFGPLIYLAVPFLFYNPISDYAKATMVHEDTISRNELIKNKVVSPLASRGISRESHSELIPQVTSPQIVSCLAVGVNSPEVHSLMFIFFEPQHPS